MTKLFTILLVTSGLTQNVFAAVKSPDGYFNCPSYSAQAVLDRGYMGGSPFSDNWNDKGGSMVVGFAADRLSIANRNEVTCYYPYPGQQGWAARTRMMAEFSYCEQGKLPSQFQCFKD